MCKTYARTCVYSCACAYWDSKHTDVTMHDSQFGTTCMSDKIYSNRKITDVLVHRVMRRKECVFPIETDLSLFRPGCAVVRALTDSHIVGNIQFIRIKNVFFVGLDRKIVRIPNTRESLAFSRDIPPSDKLVMYKMGMESFEENYSYLSKRTKSILLDVFKTQKEIKEYLLLFGKEQYLFPACSFSEVSRAIIYNNPKITVKINSTTSEETSSNSTKILPASRSSQWHYTVLILAFPIGSVPAIYTYKTEKGLFYFLHIILYKMYYAYMWSEEELPSDLLCLVGISRGNILFHCEFKTAK